MRPTSITDVRTIGITVTDQDEALDFFVETLGFEKRVDAPISPTMRWIEVAPAHATTSIALNGADGTTAVGSDTGIRFTVPNAQAEHAAMHDRGATVGEVIPLGRGSADVHARRSGREPVLRRGGDGMRIRRADERGDQDPDVRRQCVEDSVPCHIRSSEIRV